MCAPARGAPLPPPHAPPGSRRADGADQRALWTRVPFAEGMSPGWTGRRKVGAGARGHGGRRGARGPAGSARRGAGAGWAAGPQQDSPRPSLRSAAPGGVAQGSGQGPALNARPAFLPCSPAQAPRRALTASPSTPDDQGAFPTHGVPMGSSAWDALPPPLGPPPASRLRCQPSLRPRLRGTPPSSPGPRASASL